MKERYQVRLPFKKDHEPLPDNFSLCQSRLASLLKCPSLRPEISKHYDNIIQEQLKPGITEPVEQGVHSGMGKVHCIPHHEVIRVDKETTKPHVVYDTSAQAGRSTPSLNDCLYSGPPVSREIFMTLS